MKIFALLFSQIALYPTITKFHLRKFINRFFLFAIFIALKRTWKIPSLAWKQNYDNLEQYNLGKWLRFGMGADKNMEPLEKGPYESQQSMTSPQVSALLAWLLDPRPVCPRSLHRP
jgi:hypothetical protein